MGHEALIEDLRQKSRERVKRIWRKAEDSAAELRTGKRDEYERRREEVENRLKEAAESVAAPILHEGRRRALSIEDEAMARLAERLARLATEEMGRLRQQDYTSFFAELVGELPEIDWEKVKVNPEDNGLAEDLFPGVEVEGDPAIKGGFVASADGGRYRVVNTLEKRLEKGWPAILPLLMQEIIKEQDAAPLA